MTETTTGTPNSGPTRGATARAAETHWTARPALARAVRTAGWFLPTIAAVVVAFAFDRALGLAERIPAIAVRWLLLSVVSYGVAVAAERLARRLLPLSTLLGLSLTFPDQAPSRFKVALRAGHSGRRMKRRGPRMGGSTAEILALVTALSTHDRRTRGHSERVRAYATLIGDELGLKAEEREKLQWAALLHDVGKMSVPRAILNKKGRPTDAEWVILAGHPGAGATLARRLREYLGEWHGAISQHHERWDGKGYPRALKGEEITLAGRIVAVADAFEVMTAARSYKKPLPIEAARIELTRCAGAHFDPAVVRALLNVSIAELRRVVGPVAAALAMVPVTRVAEQLGRMPNATATAVAVKASGAVMAATLMAVTGPIVVHDAGAKGGALLANLEEPDGGPAGSSGTGTPGGGAGTGAGGTGAGGTGPVGAITGAADGSGAGSGSGSGSGAAGDVAISESSGTGSGSTSSGGGGSTGPRSSGIAGSGTATGSGTGTSTGTGGSGSGDGSTGSTGSTGSGSSGGPVATTVPGGDGGGWPTTVPPPPTTLPTPAPAPVPTPDGQIFYLGASAAGDTESSRLLPLSGSAPAAGSLPNFDTDRDSRPGLSLSSSAQAWAFTTSAPMTLKGNASLGVWANSAASAQLRVLVQVCSSGFSCRPVGNLVSLATVPAGSGWRAVNVNLGTVDTTVAAGSMVLVIVQLGSGDCSLAFATTTYPSAFKVT